MSSHYMVIEEVCDAIGDDHLPLAKKVINTTYPFSPLHNAGRKYYDFQKTKIFLRDGFLIVILKDRKGSTTEDHYYLDCSDGV